MGRFIESLRRRNHQEDVTAGQEAERIMQAARKKQLEKEKILRKRAENRPQWKEARGQFNKSRNEALLQKVVDLKGAESYYIDPENFDDTLLRDIPSGGLYDEGRPYFHTELHIKTTRKVKGHLYQGGTAYEVALAYISVDTDKEGTIFFRGRLFSAKLIVKAPKSRWEKDAGVLEEALGKVYYHPNVNKRMEYEDSPFFERFKDQK